MVISLVLATLFSTALLTLTILLPTILNKLLINVFPDYSFDWEEAERFVCIVRPLGYISSVIITALIVLGFILERWRISFLGSLILYLPTFSYFASTMFLLAGIGILRILWFPIIDLSPGTTWAEKVFYVGHILELGSIAYLPYDILRLTVNSIGILSSNPRVSYTFNIISFYTLLFLSMVVFFIACANWLYGKFKKQHIITSGIYRYSRHPQYLGFILWTYSLLLYDKYIFTPVKGGYFAPPSIIWLTVIMIVIAVALHEENNMIRLYGGSYIQYMSKTPFLIPLPRKIEGILLYPTKKILKKSRPQKSIEYFIILTTYYLILISLSIAYNMFLNL